ncbi:hypothetical protein, partial [uncultured Nostoc sp.]|uniref:hypothetical protein n=1 Tax=uncultured Nostoc sp. TaxID=340711 RepID=UPI0035CC42CF
TRFIASVQELGVETRFIASVQELGVETRFIAYCTGVRSRDAINRVCTGVRSERDEEVEINFFPMPNALFPLTKNSTDFLVSQSR